MNRKMSQHVVEKAEARGNLVLAAAIQFQLDFNLSFIGLTRYFCCSHVHFFFDSCFNAFNKTSVSSGLPTLMRTWSRRPGLLK